MNKNPLDFTGKVALVTGAAWEWAWRRRRRGRLQSSTEFVLRGYRSSSW